MGAVNVFRLRLRWRIALQGCAREPSSGLVDQCAASVDGSYKEMGELNNDSIAHYMPQELLALVARLRADLTV